jgi:3-dehydroquinate synthase
MIGSFYQPRCVIADTSVLSTLPQRELKAGFAEVLKYGLINDLNFFDWLESKSSELLQREPEIMVRVIKRSCEIKAEIVAKDEREAGTRALLNFGHTFGHAIEAGMGFGNVLHGEAVAMGSVMAADLSLRIGWISPSEASRVRQVFEKNFELNIVPPNEISVEQYLKFMASDKKTEKNILKFILLRSIGVAEINSKVSTHSLRATLSANKLLCGG